MVEKDAVFRGCTYILFTFEKKTRHIMVTIHTEKKQALNTVVYRQLDMFMVIKTACSKMTSNRFYSKLESKYIMQYRK